MSLTGEYDGPVHVEEQRLVEDGYGRGDEAAGDGAGLFASQSATFVEHVHLHAHVCTPHTTSVEQLGLSRVLEHSRVLRIHRVTMT